MLDERALRKPGFKDGVRVKLADGQERSFPKPRLIFKPKITDGKIDFDGGPTSGAESDENMDVLFGLREAAVLERPRVKFEMAVRLLSTNYDLKPEDFSGLIVLEPGDPDSEDAGTL